MSKLNAFRWVSEGLVFIEHIEQVPELIAVDRQVSLARKNIDAFVSGKPALNMLLWGERGLGKSTIVKMLLHEYAERGLAAVEFRHDDVLSLYELYGEIRERSDKFFMIYLDDISFDSGDMLYRMFKSVLDGGLEKKPENCIFVATSNKRHMISESALESGDIYDRDDVNEKRSLFGRFGLAIGFYPMNKVDYLKVVKSYLSEEFDGWEREAEAYAMDRGGRNGRIAKQFAIYRDIFS